MGHVQTPLASGDIPGKNWVDPLAILSFLAVLPFLLIRIRQGEEGRILDACLFATFFAPRPTEFMTKAFLVPCVCRHG
jgi:hypothetical protein